MVRRYIARCTIRQHYYPESGWGWVVVVAGVMVQILAAGIHGAVGVWLLLEGSKRYRQPPLNVGTILCELSTIPFTNFNIWSRARSLNRYKILMTCTRIPLPLSHYKRTRIERLRHCYYYYYYCFNFKINFTTLRWIKVREKQAKYKKCYYNCRKIGTIKKNHMHI